MNINFGQIKSCCGSKSFQLVVNNFSAIVFYNLHLKTNSDLN